MIAVLLWIVGFVVLYFVIRFGVRDGIVGAWKVRNRVENEEAAEGAVGWDPHRGRPSGH